jgi:hypothetical protein
LRVHSFTCGKISVFIVGCGMNFVRMACRISGISGISEVDEVYDPVMSIIDGAAELGVVLKPVIVRRL